MFFYRKAAGGRFSQTAISGWNDPAGKFAGVLPAGVSAGVWRMDGCIAGAACQQRIALGRAHEPDQREGYHRFTGIPQSGLCDDEVVSKCTLRE